jgi:hypothetical protein
MKKILLPFIVATVGLSSVWLGTLLAAEPQPTPEATPGAGQALEIAPPVINLKANPGQSITTQISIRGVSNEPLLVTGQVNDFTAAGEDGTPKILLEDDEANPYSLRSWINPLPELLLEPKKVENMTITINVPANAAPGGYYGVVRFTGTPPELKDTGVSLSASLGSLLFIRVNGNAKEGLDVEEFSANQGGGAGWLFESTPINFLERLKNTGNTHLQPAGQITITDMFGQKVATVNVNLPPRNILPQSTRKFEQPLDSTVIGNKMLFGRYTADLRLTYGDKQQVVTSSLTFWVIPWRLIAIAIAVLVGGFFLLRFLIRRYNQRIINRSQGGGRLGGGSGGSGLTLRSRRRK